MENSFMIFFTMGRYCGGGGDSFFLREGKVDE